jgi:uncharacterized protein with von Willebrand factor type A (vWA) domain
MSQEKCDLLIHFPDKDHLKPFEINMLLFADDGFIYTAHVKSFEEEFSAKKIEKYLVEWYTWPQVSKERLSELKNIRKGKDK